MPVGIQAHLSGGRSGSGRRSVRSLAVSRPSWAGPGNLNSTDGADCTSGAVLDAAGGLLNVVLRSGSCTSRGEDPLRGLVPSEDEQPDLSAMPRRLLESGADYALVTMWNGDRWPAQQGVIAASGVGDEVYNDGYSALWRIARRSE